MKIKLPRFEKGKRKDELNRWADQIERLANLVVDGSTGLQLQETAAGNILSFIPQAQPGRRAIVTQAVTPPTSATATHSASAGWGYAQLQRYDVGLNKYVNMGSLVKVINPFPSNRTTATAGTEIWVEFSDGVWQMPSENCKPT